MFKEFIVILFLVLLLPPRGSAQEFDWRSKANPRLINFLQKRDAIKATERAKSMSFASKQTECSDDSSALNVDNKRFCDEHIASDESGPLIGVLITANDVETVTQWLEQRKYNVNTRLRHTLTVRIDQNDIDSLLMLSDVIAVSALNHHRLMLDNVRSDVNADNAHNGQGLYAPYSGKGVVVGIIDVGFQYTHPAFRHTDGSSRFIASWQSDATAMQRPLTTSQDILNAIDDGSELSHATHVTSIAAGGKGAINSPYYGLAPDAEIVAVPCPNLNDSEVIDGINYIASVAEKGGKPYVVNMSFGSMESTHNGRSQFASAIEELCNDGAILVAAAGNDGGKLRHFRKTFNSSQDSAVAYIVPSNDNLEILFVSQDSTAFTVHVYKYNANSQHLTYITQCDMQSCNSYLTASVEPVAKQAIVVGYFDMGAHFPALQDESECLLFTISGSSGQTVDAWICDGINEFGSAPSGSFINTKADASYCIMSPADAPSVIAVTAHNTRKKWLSLEGNEFMKYWYTLNDHAPYASLGPLVNSENVKPTVSAPGTIVISAINDKNGIYTSDARLKDQLTTQFTYANHTYYYGIESGTSMAAPVVTGAIALWLEAAPDLTPNQVRDIIVRTSRKDSYTGNVPNATWGYGKLDVYEGLKESLLISSIPSVRNSDFPFTLQAYSDHWSVLLNTDEDYVSAILVNMNGMCVWSIERRGIKRGCDFEIPTSSLPKGIYLLRLASRNHRQTQKIVIN